MTYIAIGAWIILTIFIHQLFSKICPIRIYSNMLDGIVQEIILSAVISTVILVFVAKIFFDYIAIIVPIIIIFITLILYKYNKNPKIIIVGIILAVISFPAIKMYNSKNQAKSVANKDQSQEIFKEEDTSNSNKDNNEKPKEELENQESNSKEDKAQLTSNGGESDINESIGNNVKSYIENFVVDVNTGQANLCLNYLEHNSPLYNEQVKNIPNISKNFKERFISAEIQDIKTIADNKYSVQVTEKIDISKGNENFETKEFNNSYIVVKIGDNYLIRDMNMNTF